MYSMLFSVKKPDFSFFCQNCRPITPQPSSGAPADFVTTFSVLLVYREKKASLLIHIILNPNVVIIHLEL
jgi:hypothetical protein